MRHLCTAQTEQFGCTDRAPDAREICVVEAPVVKNIRYTLIYFVSECNGGNKLLPTGVYMLCRSKYGHDHVAGVPVEAARSVVCIINVHIPCGCRVGERGHIGSALDLCSDDRRTIANHIARREF